MNIYTRQIMQLLNIDAETALKVQDEMSIEGLDFSECTQRSFNASAKRCFQLIQQ